MTKRHRRGDGRSWRAAGQGSATRGRLLLLVAIGLVLLPATGAFGRTAAPSSTSQSAVPDELIVGFRSSLSLGVQDAIVRQAGGATAQRFRQIDASLVRAPGGATGAAAKALVSDPRVRYVEPNSLVSASATPNDPSYGSLWGMNNTGQTGGTPDADIDAPEAWDVATGSSSVVVGVTDSGIDFSHPDLAAQQWVNTGENCGSPDPSIPCADRTDGVDDDANGLVDDWRGWDWVSNDNNPFDDNSHGTHVAGTIGAVGNNGVGVVGVNWNVKIAALKFLNAAGNGSTAGAISATLYSADEGIQVSNNSWGGGPFSQPLLDAIEYGAGRGMLFVAAAGNFNTNTDVSPHYPSSYGADVITAVAATEHNDVKWISSNYGLTTVDLAAPGVNILSTVPAGGYQFFNGTSMATPHVAGAAALVKSRYPGATAYGLKALLMRTVDPKPSLNGVTVTGGRLNLNSAVSCSNAPKAVLLAPLNGFTVNTGQSFAIRVLGANCATPAGIANVSVTVNGTPVTMTRGEPGQRPLHGDVHAELRRAAHGHRHGDDRRGHGRAHGHRHGDRGRRRRRRLRLRGHQRPMGGRDGRHAPPAEHRRRLHALHPPLLVLVLRAGAHAGVRLHERLPDARLERRRPGANNPVIPSAGAPNGVIAPFWDDLNLAVGGAVYSSVTGSAPNRAVHFEWFNVPHFVNVGAATLEVSLYETTNEIRFRYLDTDFGNVAFNAGQSATAGVENQAGSDGTQYSRNTPVLTNGKAISCSQGEPPPPPALTITTTSLPGGTVGQPYSQPVTATGGAPPYSWSVISGSLPPGLTLSTSGTPSATLSGAPTTQGTYNFTVQATDSAAGTDTQALSITIAAAPALTITTTSLPGGTVGQPYSQSVTATGGTTPYSWSVVSGSLPPGLALSPTGTPSATLSGTPTTEGTYNFTVQVTDNVAATDTQALSITVAPFSPSSAPAFGSAGAAAAALAATVNVPYPSGTAATDLLVLLVLTKDTVDINTPSGFSDGGARNQGSLRAEWFWKRATGSESGTLTVTKASGVNLLFGRMYRFTGVTTSGTPYEAAAATGGTTSTLTPVDVTTLGTNRRVVALTALEDDLALGSYAGGTATVPEDVAEALTSTGTDGALGLNSLARTSAEAFDVGSQTIAFNRNHALFTFALIPA